MARTEKIAHKTYYEIDEENPPSVDEILNNWYQHNMQLYDENFHAFYNVDDIYKYREYNWSKYNSRRSPKEWDELFDSIKKSGWDDNNPAIITLGKNNIAKISEGNHRLSIVKELQKSGINLKIPVRFIFYINVDI